jgi:hypothetical protein
MGRPRHGFGQSVATPIPGALNALRMGVVPDKWQN